MFIFIYFSETQVSFLYLLCSRFRFPSHYLCVCSRLDLSANSIGVDGATAIAAWLPQSHSLRALILDVNAVGEDGVAALGAAAFAHPRLRELVRTSLFIYF